MTISATVRNYSDEYAYDVRVRFYLGDMLVIDAWNDLQGGWITRDLFVAAGTYEMRVEYYENTGAAYVTFNL